MNVKRLMTMTLVLMFVGATPVWADGTRYTLKVDGLACPYCAYGIEKKLKALDGVNPATVSIKLNEGVVVFVADQPIPNCEELLKKLINDAGFTLRGVAAEPAPQSAPHGDDG